ncbi:MAG: hypothetical protein EA342_14680 [Leptolyngbya sp. LCM1.Bin17]|nr:MAG: hypothetical protein EA342_14680 [Leptolyngbya sp. LCM1.Bin17]
MKYVNQELSQFLHKSNVEEIMIKQAFLLSAGLLLAALVKPVLADLILPGRCHQGYCYENKFVSKTRLGEGQDGTLYAVELASRNWQNGVTVPGAFEPSRTTYVYCSTRRPMLIFELENTYYINTLNPGGRSYGFNMSDYPIYWATCHNFVGPDFFSERMTNQARRLGYPLNLTQGQSQIRELSDVLN